jgi:hypothetical protein
MTYNSLFQESETFVDFGTQRTIFGTHRTVGYKI